MAETVRNLKQIQEILYGILCAIDDVCTAADIPYMLTDGSAIGAVREKGFIPWDDDMDITVWRRDLPRLRKAMEERLPAPYRLVRPEEMFPLFHDYVWRVVDTRYHMREPDDYDRAYDNLENYVWVDIFTWTMAGNSLKELKRRNRQLKALWALSMSHRYSMNWEKYTPVQRLGIRMLSAVGKRIPMERLLAWHDRVCADGAEETLYVGRYDTVYAFYTKEDAEGAYRAEWFRDTVRLPFGERNFPVPKEYDAYLTTEYGDYMTPVKDAEVYIQHRESQG